MKTGKFIVILFVFLFILILKPLFCNSQDEIALPGSNGIFIILGKNIPGENSLMNKVHYYYIERKESKKSTWKKIARVTGPKNIEDFGKKIELFNKILETNVVFTDRNLQKYWMKVAKCPFADSLDLAGLSYHILFASGVIFYDSTASREKSYIYQVSPVDFIGNKMNSFTSNIVYYPVKKVFSETTFTGSMKMGKTIVVKWKTENGTLTRDYRIFKQTDLRQPFVRLKIQGYFSADNYNQNFSFNDEMGSEKYARYYLIPVDAWGNKGIATDTVLVSMINKSNLPAPVFIRTKVNKENGSVIINWKLSSVENISMVSIYRSIFMDSLFLRIADLVPTDSVFTDFLTEPNQKYYYYLTTTSLLNETSFPSVTVFAIAENNIKPDKPEGLKAESIINGIKLRWKAGDPFISGYYVFRGYGKGGKMVQASDFIKNSDTVKEFIDTSEILEGNKMYSYCVQSISKSYILGDFSDTILIRPGIITRPEPPSNITVVQKNDGIHISWSDVTEEQDGIMGYNVFRTEPGSDKALLLNNDYIPDNLNYFTDTSAEYGMTYIYWVQTLDIFSGKSNQGKSVAVKVTEPPLRSPSFIRVYVVNTGITIEWDEVLLPNVAGYKIYRFQRGEKALWLATLEKDKTTFTDNNILPGQLYFYYITTISKSGKESLPENEASIRK